MENNKLKWCFGLKDGLRIEEPSEILAKSYMEEAKASLQRAEKNLKDGDLLWATVVIYYAEYYSIYSFLQKLGIKCGNHFCSIILAGFLLGGDKIEKINQHKNKRVDAQYYMRIGKEEEVMSMLQEAKRVVSVFDDIVSNLSAGEIVMYRKKLKPVGKRP